MSGYANPFVLLPFPELGDDVSVLLKNPQLQPPAAITPEDVPVDEHGQPLDPQAANEAMYKVMARLIVSWKVYEAPGVDIQIDPDADPADVLAALGTGEPRRLGAVTPENIAKLPLAIINRIGEEVGRVADPR
jgi:hypothetical protein